MNEVTLTAETEDISALPTVVYTLDVSLVAVVFVTAAHVRPPSKKESKRGATAGPFRSRAGRCCHSGSRIRTSTAVFATLCAPARSPGLEAWMASFGERVVGAMRLDANTFEEIERDPTAIGQAVGVIVLSAVSTGLGNMFRGGVSGILGQVLIALIGYAVWAVLVWIIGTKVMPDPDTKADFAETFRVIGFAAAPGILGIVSIVPLLGYLVLLVLWLWQLAAMVVAVKAVLVVVIGFCVNFMVTLLLGMLFLGSAMMRGALS